MCKTAVTNSNFGKFYSLRLPTSLEFNIPHRWVYFTAASIELGPRQLISFTSSCVGALATGNQMLGHRRGDNQIQRQCDKRQFSYLYCCTVHWRDVAKGVANAQLFGQTELQYNENSLSEVVLYIFVNVRVLELPNFKSEVYLNAANENFKP